MSLRILAVLIVQVKWKHDAEWKYDAGRKYDAERKYGTEWKLDLLLRYDKYRKILPELWRTEAGGDPVPL